MVFPPANLYMQALPFCLFSLPREGLKCRKKNDEERLHCPVHCPVWWHWRGPASAGREGRFGLMCIKLPYGLAAALPLAENGKGLGLGSRQENARVRIRLHQKTPHTDVRGPHRGEIISFPPLKTSVCFSMHMVQIYTHFLK